MIRHGVIALLVLFGACYMALGQSAVVTEDIAVLYNGESKLQGLVYGSWGNNPGIDPQRGYAPLRLGKNVYGLQLLTTGRYQGARFDFQQPIDLTTFANEKNVYLEMYIAEPPRPRTEGDAAAASSPNPSDPAATSAPSAPVFPAEFLEEIDTTKPSTVRMPRLSDLRVTLFTEKGQGQIVITPDQFYPKEDIRGVWNRIDIPLSALHAKLPVGGKLTRMLITTDVPAYFFVGRMAFVRDVTPVSISLFSYPAFMEAGQRLFFVARVNAGLSRYDVSWDFDTNAGHSVDAMGERMTYTYDNEGTYLITCTVRDLSGGRAPFSKTLEVKVTPPAL